MKNTEHSENSPSDYYHFIEEVKKKTGIDLSSYKEAQMKRRLMSFYEKRGFSSFQDFFQNGLNKNEDILAEFLERMTINVSEFYRNPKRWNVLEETIIPRLKENSSHLKIWSAACSTGEEPYTLSMILMEKYRESRHSILATDIDEVILKRARAGLYTERALKELSDEMIRTYFIPEDPGYRVQDKIKNTVTYRKHNLLADSYDTGFDLIICRNVLIYFTEEAKQDIYIKFNKALKMGGILFVGSTEQIFNPARYGFQAEDTFFYKKVKSL
ncbi:protein-glutamate O-methyltransferase CheR [Salibacterium salarium]|uniref:protein-glutamate O-methyltransferase n=1 Tax=Salibacterium salarium TaxID=284579 RepID=A0A3R9P9N6_9BACI|nr:protein-glutamate O-methyltransferase CheR [Salibacterium salarium]RSL33463.1 protein-glutamate O-methyltransferase CheR [Salibacterium salarium]